MFDDIDFKVEWDLNDGMTPKWKEWSWEEKDINKEWRNSELGVLPYLKNIPHFTFISSLQVILKWPNWLEWTEND